MQYQRVSSLSGGEKRRLHLLRILMAAPNVLILDEPTNDLDLETLNVLEDYLDQFRGAVIVVSHDRSFLDRVTTHLFAFEDGRLVPYIGGYRSYLEAQERKRAERLPQPAAEEAKPVAAVRARAPRLSYKEQRDLETIDDRIAGLEEEIAELCRAMEKEASDYTRVLELTQRQEAKQQELDQAMEYWMYLQDKLEQIQAAGKEG